MSLSIDRVRLRCRVLVDSQVVTVAGEQYACNSDSRAPPPSLKEVGNQAYPQFCSGLLRNSIMNIIHAMVLTNSIDANSDEYVLVIAQVIMQ